MLIRSAFSANIKERRDCSTALFDDKGGWSCRRSTSPCTSARCPTPSPPSWRATRARRRLHPQRPFTGGTHLPDITLVSRTALGFAASRAHHADVGGASRAACPRRRGRSTRRASSFRRRDSTTRRWTRSSRRCAIRTNAAATFVRSSRRSSSPRSGSTTCAHATAREPVAAAMDELYAYSERLVRAGITDDARRPLRSRRLPRRRNEDPGRR